MRIRDVSEKYDIPATTIRYYIESGVLVPNKINTHYLFNEVDLWELEIIIKLKSLEFSIDEILQFMRVVRTYSLDDENIYEHLLPMYEKKHKNLIRERQRTITAINIITNEINDIHKIVKSTNRFYGVPTFFISMFRCPGCGSYFDISKMKIKDNQIMSADLKCECGYNAVIEDGIFVSPANEIYESEDFNMSHFKEIPTSDHDFLFFQYMNQLSEHYMAMLSKIYAWIDQLLQGKDLSSRIIYIPDLASHFFYKYADKPYWKNAYFIISGYSLHSVQSMKRHLETRDLDLNILFVANTNHDLPIRYDTIDLWIDSIASYNFSFFHGEHSLHECIAPYLHFDSEVIGITKYFRPGAVSLKNIKKIFRDPLPDNSLFKTFEETLAKNKYDLLVYDELGYVTNPGSYYSYIEKDDKHWFCGYRAQYKGL